ncbi:hypothetical protein CLI85_01275 [Tannerella forsythia]|nr:hypothetical protein CLI85_01275 [Tannerella forsythia]
MTKGGVRTPHKKGANTRFAPTLTTLITADYFSLFVFFPVPLTGTFFRPKKKTAARSRFLAAAAQTVLGLSLP